MEWTLKGSPNLGTERRRSQSEVDSVHKRMMMMKGTNQKEDTSI